MTSRYNIFVSVVNLRSVGGESLISESESSVSEFPDGSRGGVGILEMGCGNGERDSISRSKSWPFRKEFSVLRYRTVPQRASTYGKTLG